MNKRIKKKKAKQAQQQELEQLEQELAKLSPEQVEAIVEALRRWEEELDKEIKEKFKQVDAIIPFISLLEEMLKTFGAKDKED